MLRMEIYIGLHDFGKRYKYSGLSFVWQCRIAPPPKPLRPPMVRGRSRIGPRPNTTPPCAEDANSKTAKSSQAAQKTVLATGTIVVNDNFPLLDQSVVQCIRYGIRAARICNTTNASCVPSRKQI